MRLSILWEEGSRACVQLAGQVKQPMATPLEEPLGELLGPDGYNRGVLLDMSEVEVLDSSGIGWLLVCHKRFRDSGGDFVLHSLSPMARNVMKVLNMQAVFKIADNDESAIGMLEEEKP